MIGVNARITYWLDAASDPDNAVWVVDIGDEDGCETLSEHGTDETAARHEAMRQAARRGLPCYHVGEHGELTAAR